MEEREMKFLPWVVLFLTVYLSSFLLFVIFREAQYVEGGVGDFLKARFMRETPQRRRPFLFSMKPWKISPESPRSASLDIHRQELRWSVIVFVKSHSSHRSRRMLARMTWSSFEVIDGVRIETVFVVGRPETAEEKAAVEKENEKFGDLLQLHLEEKYTSVGFKTLAGMQYAGTHFPSEWMYVSCDDDIAPDWIKLIEKFDELRQVATKTQDDTKICSLEGHMPIMCGFGSVSNALPKRTEDSKWCIEQSDYPLPVYPTYCLGGFYGMSVKLASELYEISRTLPFFWIDDVWITGFLRLKRFFSPQPPCQTDGDAGMWSSSEEPFSTTGNEHELLIEWAKFVAKIHEKEYIYVNQKPGYVRGTPVPYEWKAWLEYVFQEQPAALSTKIIGRVLFKI